MEFDVSVEKRMYSSGKVTVDCESPEEAIQTVQGQIDRGELQTTDIEWGDETYEDCSFVVTDDAD